MRGLERLRRKIAKLKEEQTELETKSMQVLGKNKAY